MEKRQVNFDTPMNIERLRKLKILLKSEPLTSDQLTTSLKISKPTLSILLKNFGSDVHIAGWIALPNAIAPKYFWGNREDAPRPTREEPASNMEQLLQASTEVFNRKLKPLSAKRDISVSMLFGNKTAD